MQSVPRTNSMENDFVAGRSPSTAHKWLAAGIATVGAFAVATSSVSPVIDDLKAQERAVAAQERAVALAAAENPLEVLQKFVAETLVNSGYLQINATNAAEALGAAFVDQDILGQLGDVLSASASDPEATLAALVAFQALQSTAIQNALFAPDDPATPAVEGGVFTRLGPELENLFTNILPDMLKYDTPTQGATPGYQPRQGDEVPGVFTQPLFELNYWFVEYFLRVLQPLTPINDLAGQFVASLPGGDESQLPELLGALSEFGATRALLGPFQTTAFQFTAVLDSVYEAVESGDNEAVAGELANLPVKLANAFVNGFTPEFSLCTNANGCAPRSLEWPSQLDPGSQGGLVRYLLVDFPNSVTRILTGTAPTPTVPSEPLTPPTQLPSSANTALSKVSSTALPSDGNTVTLPTGDGTNKDTTRTTKKGASSDRQTNVVSRIADRVQGNIAKATGAATGGKHAADAESATGGQDRVTVRDLVSRLGIDKKPTKNSGDTGTDNEKKDAPTSEDSSTS